MGERWVVSRSEAVLKLYAHLGRESHLSKETVSQCHSEAQPKNLVFITARKCEMLRFAQHDIDGACVYCNTASREGRQPYRHNGGHFKNALKLECLEQNQTVVSIIIIINLRHHLDHLVAEAFPGCYLDRGVLSQLQRLQPRFQHRKLCLLLF